MTNTRSLDNITNKFGKLGDTELQNVEGGVWQVVLAGAAIYLGKEAFDHSDQIANGWKKAGKRHW